MRVEDDEKGSSENNGAFRISAGRALYLATVSVVILIADRNMRTKPSISKFLQSHPSISSFAIE